MQNSEKLIELAQDVHECLKAWRPGDTESKRKLILRGKRLLEMWALSRRIECDVETAKGSDSHSGDIILQAATFEITISAWTPRGFGCVKALVLRKLSPTFTGVINVWMTPAQLLSLGREDVSELLAQTRPREGTSVYD